MTKVQPSYPPLAKQARIQGTVVLQAVIGKDGSIQHLKAVSGHPMLIQSAIDAVSRWKYKPYYPERRAGRSGYAGDRKLYLSRWIT